MKLANVDDYLFVDIIFGMWGSEGGEEGREGGWVDVGIEWILL